VTEQQAFIHLPAEPSSVAKARGLARKSCAEWGISCAELELVTSELVTNAVRHAGGEIDLAITLRGAVVRIEVADDSPDLPTTQEAAPSARSGRGLAIVEKLTGGWWVDWQAGHKIVGAELPCDPTDTHPPR